jgi:quercetin dioxygenase-like cupin family protein
MPSIPFVVSEQTCELEGWDDPARGVVQWRTLLSGDRTPTEALTMGVADVRPLSGPRPRLHRHAQPETYYILSGHGVISLDGQERPLAPGDAVFIPGGAWHAAWCTGEDALRILYVFAANSFDEVIYEFAD